MAINRERKGLGIIPKVVLFSLVPGYLIIGFVVFLNNQEIMESIKEKYIEESFSVTRAIQNSIQIDKIFRNPDLLNRSLALITRLNIQVFKSTLYAEQSGEVLAIASTDPEKIGQKADPHDAEPLLTGNRMIKELNRDHLHYNGNGVPPL